MSCENSLQNSIKLDVKTEQMIDKIAELILDCDAILFTSGAGMGISSGLGTFRGIGASVWSPLLEEPKLDYMDICDPSWFRKEQGNSILHNTANFGYAFWVHGYNSFTKAIPHQGYFIVKQWSQLDHIKYVFNFTSNIDGHWRKSGWNESSIIECHGSIDYMQCIDNCYDDIWSTNNLLKLQVDPRTNCVIDPLPLCPHCNQLSRPNVLMFGGDWEYSGKRYNEQIKHYKQFKSNILEAKSKLLIIEIGAGRTVPTVRNESEMMFDDKRWIAHLVRINPSNEDSIIEKYYKNQNKKLTFELSMDALTALTFIDQALNKKKISLQ